MGQQSSRKNSNGDCGCGCGSWERRRFQDAPTSVHKYVSALTDRWSGRQCACRRGRGPECVCTSYRPRADNQDDRVQVLTLESTELRRELDALVIAEGETNNENRDTVPEVYVLSVASRGSTGPAMGAMGGGVQVVCGELRALLVRGPLPSLNGLNTLNTQMIEDRGANTRVHSQMDYIHCLVPDLQEITACSFYWGKMDRYEAEKLLDNKPEGTFLLRDSAQEEHLFSVSFRKYGRSLHARIEHYRQRFSFDLHDPAVYSAPTVTGLIDHYKDPACVMFFEPMLTSPLPRRTPFSLQQLARAVIVSHITYDGVEKLPLPSRIRSYLKEYHYRQRVRLRRLDTDVNYQPC